MSVAGSQQQIFLRLASSLRPHWRRDAGLPARIQRLLTGRRAFGARDRRLYRELIFTTLRYLAWVEPLLDHSSPLAIQLVAWLAADIPATRAFRSALVGDWPPCPANVTEKALVAGQRLHLPAGKTTRIIQGDGPGPNEGQANKLPLPLPNWFREHCPDAFAPAQVDALLARAPLWLRLQTPDISPVTDEFDADGWAWQRSAVIPSALRLLDEADVTKSHAHGNGHIEVQDLGSQMILTSIGIEPGGRWLDACAGAGGKTLQLAGLLGANGHIDACDVRPAALAELRERAQRARLDHITTSSTPPGDAYDGVLVDAPCSGSGTWRRAPHLKWTTTPAQIAAAARRQLALLREFSRRVRPGGRLVYATCSLSRHENEDVVAAFLAGQAEFAPERFATPFGFTPHAGGITILPAQYDTDGFFAASLRRS